MTKSELRKLYLEKRLELSAKDVASLSASISDRFFELLDPGSVGCLHTYLPIDKFNEPDTRLILERVWSEFPAITTTVPRVDFATHEMESVVYSSVCPVLQNKWGISEPADGEIVAAENIDVVIVPLLCFDESRHRVGYGKGFYDRFINRCRPDCLKVGLSFFPPVAQIDDIHEGDLALDVFILPDQVFQPE